MENFEATSRKLSTPPTLNLHDYSIKTYIYKLYISPTFIMCIQTFHLILKNFKLHIPNFYYLYSKLHLIF